MITYLTQEGHEKLNAEVEDLKGRGRQEAAAAIGEAREKGDLSENAEYDAAKDAQGLLELRINEIETILGSAQIFDMDNIDTSIVGIFTNVKLKNLKVNKEFVYKLVSEAEANLKEKKISVTSPIGKGLLGHKVGDVAEITTPAGLIKMEILEITA